MSSSIFKGGLAVFISAVILLFFGINILLFPYSFASESKERTEMRMGPGAYAVKEMGKSSFGSEVEIQLSFSADKGEHLLLSLYVIDEDNREKLLNPSSEEENLTFLEKVENLEIIYKKNCTGNSSFKFKVETDHELHIVIFNKSDNEEDFILEVVVKERTESGVCFAVFLVVLIIALLMFKASFEIERKQSYQDIFYYAPQDRVDENKNEH